MLNLTEGVAIISSLCLFVLFVYMMTSKKLKAHPYPLIGLTCGVESFFYFQVLKPNRICDYDLAIKFAYSTAIAKVPFGVPWEEATSMKTVFGYLLWF